MGQAMKRSFEDVDDDVIRRHSARGGRNLDTDVAFKNRLDSAAQEEKAPGTALIPYEDPEKYTFKNLRTPKKRSPTIIYWPIRLIRSALLLVALIAFIGGLYENVTWGAHKMFGTPIVGTVASVEAAASGQARPVVEYIRPLDGSEWRVASSLPRGDLAVGDQVTVSVITGSEGLTRIERSSFWRMVSIAALLIGGVVLWATVSVWPRLESALGWRRFEESPAASHTRTIVALTITITLVGVSWMKFVYAPWLGVSELTMLVTAPDDALRAAGQRCGDVGTGPLNDCELTVLGLPVGDTAAKGAYLAALEEGDFVSLARYNAAIADPEIAFSFDWAAAAPLLLESEPEVLIGLLLAGQTPPPDIAGDLLAGAEARGWASVSSMLYKLAQPGA